MTSQPTIVLLHGLFGFRKLLWVEYFHGVAKLYREMGLRVIVTTVPSVGTIKNRAAALAEQLQDEQKPLHLLGHSMGGLDARYWISHLGGAEKVASLTTLTTPHRGSAAATGTCRTLSLFRLFAGVHDLTLDKMENFNRNTPNDPGIIYRSYAAYRPVEEHPWIVRRYGHVIQSIEGDNDSQVSVSSAKWGEHIATLPCDHFEVISKNLWFNPFGTRSNYDPMPVYRDIGEWILQQ